MKKSETFANEAKNYFCKISLNDLNFTKENSYYSLESYELNSEVYMNLVLFSPSNQSNLGDKLSKKIEKHYDSLVKDILKGLDIDNYYFYSAYEPKSKDKFNLQTKIKSDNKTFICLYCPQSFGESLYSSIRNALAHGNILKKGNYYYLYSVSKSEDKKIDEFNKSLSFLLKIRDLKKLDSYITAFKKYN